MTTNRPFQTARRLAVAALFSVAIWATIIFLIAGCATKPPHTPTGAVVKAATTNVNTATRLSTDARSAVLDAKRELASPEPNAGTIRLKLNQADQLLQKQHAELQLAHTSLAEAQKMSALTAKEMAKLQRESDRYRVKYESLKKYRWAVIIISGWIIVKFLGSIGAWSPHGRLARFLIG
jgi:hypothetical protein